LFAEQQARIFSSNHFRSQLKLHIQSFPFILKIKKALKNQASQILPKNHLSGRVGSLRSSSELALVTLELEE